MLFRSGAASPSITVRKSFILSIYGLIGLFTTAPILSALLATLVAHLAGAQLSEAQVHPCVVLGVDLGPLLCGMFVSSWLGVVTVPRKLPRILRSLRETVRTILARKPQVLVIIDSPGYTLRLARSVRRRDPSIPIVDYVSPSVWAWRPGRARAMRGTISGPR